MYHPLFGAYLIRESTLFVCRNSLSQFSCTHNHPPSNYSIYVKIHWIKAPRTLNCMPPSINPLASLNFTPKRYATSIQFLQSFPRIISGAKKPMHIIVCKTGSHCFIMNPSASEHTAYYTVPRYLICYAQNFRANAIFNIFLSFSQ